MSLDGILSKTGGSRGFWGLFDKNGNSFFCCPLLPLSLDIQEQNGRHSSIEISEISVETENARPLITDDSSHLAWVDQNSATKPQNVNTLGEEPVEQLPKNNTTSRSTYNLLPHKREKTSEVVFYEFNKCWETNQFEEWRLRLRTHTRSRISVPVSPLSCFSSSSSDCWLAKYSVLWVCACSQSWWRMTMNSGEWGSIGKCAMHGNVLWWHKNGFKRSNTEQRFFSPLRLHCVWKRERERESTWRSWTRRSKMEPKQLILRSNQRDV